MEKIKVDCSYLNTGLLFQYTILILLHFSLLDVSNFFLPTPGIA